MTSKKLDFIHKNQFFSNIIKNEKELISIAYPSEKGLKAIKAALAGENYIEKSLELQILGYILCKQALNIRQISNIPFEFKSKQQLFFICEAIKVNRS